MATVTFDVLDSTLLREDFVAAFSGAYSGARISFASAELLMKTLGGRRWELLSRMAGAGPLSIREAARRAERDVKAVHGDIQILLRVGVLDKNEDGRVVFPFDAVHVDFTLHAA